MNPTLIILLDLLRTAIIRCGGILQNPQQESSVALSILVTPGAAPLLVRDPSVIRFLLAMRAEGIDLRFHLEPQEDQSQLIVMRLSKQNAQVAVPVARTAPAALSVGETFLAVGLTLRGILTGLSRTLADLRVPAPARLHPLQAGRAQGWAVHRAPGI